MAIEDDYRQFMVSRSASGSGTTESYVRAMNITDEVLKLNGLFLQPRESVWEIRDESRLQRLLEFVKQEQRKSDGGIYRTVKTKSYWKKKFCSAAISRFIDFVITLQ